MRNLYREFLALVPQRLLDVGDVVAADGGMATVMLPGGGVIQARGVALVGQRVFVRDGAIDGPAPTLDYVDGEA